jgi:hypothetical protein
MVPPLTNSIIINTVRSNLLIFALAVAAGAAGPEEAFLGRWDLTVTAGAAEYASWLEVTRAPDGKLAARMVGRSGSVRPVEVRRDGGELIFASYRGRVAGDRLEGTGTDRQGNPVKWVGVKVVRPPAPKGEPRWGRPITLFNGKDLTGWTFRTPRGKDCWVAENGVIVNRPPCPDLLTEQRFRDFKLHIEYNLDPKSNSGIYLRGRYEVQIADQGPRELDSHGVGGLYGFLAPKVKAAKPPGEWQAFDITLVGYHVTVKLNGTTIIENEEIPGITGAALDSRETEPGPIMLQGDHGRVQFRNITITPGL